jgi:hypothetical protein
MSDGTGAATADGKMQDDVTWEVGQVAAKEPKMAVRCGF